MEEPRQEIAPESREDAPPMDERPVETAPGDEAPPDAPSAGEDDCEGCGGTGRVDEAPCPECDGRGRVVRAVGGG